MKQYEIRWAHLPPPVGRRPVLLLSRPAAYRYLRKVLVAEITSTIRGIRQEVLLNRRDGLPAQCVANFDNLHTLHVDRLGESLGTLRASRSVEVKRALGFALAWSELQGL